MTVPASFCGWLELDSGGNGGAALTGAGVAADDGRFALLRGRVTWRRAELSELAARAGASAALLDAYRRFGERCFEQIGGAFAAVVVDAGDKRVLAAVDRLGQMPLYFAERPQGLCVADDPRRLFERPWLGPELTAQGLYHYMYFHMLPSPGSVYRGVGRLPCAHFLDYRSGRLRLARYWRPDFTRSDAAPEVLGEQMFELLRDAVRRGAADADRPGAFLSGGLDSSTVTGLLSERHAAAPSFSIGFDADGYDEIPYARISAAHFGSDRHEYYVTPDDVVAAMPLIAESYAEPFGNSSAIPTYYCARLAAGSGVTRLLAGDGGDELFAGNERYAKQGVFELYYGLPGALRGALGPALTRLPRLPLLGKLRSYAEQARLPLPDRLQSYNFLHRVDPLEMFDAALLAEVDRGEPLRRLRERYDEPGADASTLDRMLYLDWKFTLADNDLRKVSQMCAHNGLEVVYPFMDDELVAFSCTVPDRLKLRPGRLRHFYKQAARGFLPDAVLDKSKHGFGLPFGVWMRDHARLREMAYDTLGALRGRGYFRPGFIDTAIGLHRGGHAGYYGELVWIMTMLELWLQRHRH